MIGIKRMNHTGNGGAGPASSNDNSVIAQALLDGEASESLSTDDAVALGHIARTLEHHINVQHNLCTALESIADALPEDVRNDDCLALARSVYPVIHRSHVFEEDVLFPALKTRFGGDPELDETLDRLHGEHWEDEAFAEEVHHELTAFAADRSAVSVDKLGYMLRGFFTGLRRHIAFEREHILPMIEQADDRR